MADVRCPLCGTLVEMPPPELTPREKATKKYNCDGVQEPARGCVRDVCEYVAKCAKGRR
jgi:hypothetical protein